MYPYVYTYTWFVFFFPLGKPEKWSCSFVKHSLLPQQISSAHTLSLSKFKYLYGRPPWVSVECGFGLPSLVLVITRCSISSLS